MFSKNHKYWLTENGNLILGFIADIPVYLIVQNMKTLKDVIYTVVYLGDKNTSKYRVGKCFAANS